MTKEELFISPTGHQHDQLVELFDRVIQIILQHYRTSSTRNPLPTFEGIAPDLFTFPDTGLTTDELLTELELVFDKSMNHLSPSYIGHMDSMPTIMSIIGEASKAAINNNMLGVEMSSVFTRMEAAVIDEFIELFGFRSKAGGLMGSGGSLVNLQAMTVARNVKLKIPDGDLSNVKGRPIVFASELAHASIEKNMMILGLGRNNLEKIKINENGKMMISDLKKRIEYHINQGNTPFCVVATLATTSAGSIDPIQDIHDLCKTYNLWLHADAVYGGAAILSKKHKHVLAGIDKADSITFNPQKWMNIAKTCSLLLFNDFKQAVNHFRVDMPYYSKAADSLYNLGEISIQGSRSAEILKLWLSIRHIGKKGYESIIDQTYDLTFYFEELIRKRSYLSIYARPETNSFLFRFKEDGKSDELTSRLQQFLLQDKDTYLSIQTVNSKKWLKYLSLNPYTTKEILDQTMEQIDQFADQHLS